MPDEDQAYYREFDEEDNERSRIPQDEEVELQSVWIAECYTPGHTGNLIENIKRIGWGEDNSRIRAMDRANSFHHSRCIYDAQFDRSDR